MSDLFNNLTVLDRKLADRWKIRTRDNVRHILTPADIDFILGDLIRSARTTDITANQGSAIIMMYNASVAAAKMVIDKTAIDSNRDWQRAYEKVVKAVGRRYKQYGVRYIRVEKGEGASERTKFNELLQQITMVNNIGGIALSLGDFGKTVLKSIPLATGSH